MSKHIKLRAEYVKSTNSALIQVIEQTHRNSEFGHLTRREYNTDVTMFVHEKVALISVCNSCFLDCRGYITGAIGWITGMDIDYILYMHGRDADNRDKIKIPADVYPKIKAAVKAYNEYYK